MAADLDMRWTVIRTMSMCTGSQIQRDTSGRGYYQRKRAAGKSHKEALRCLKRRLADVVYRTMTNDWVTSLPAST